MFRQGFNGSFVIIGSVGKGTNMYQIFSLQSISLSSTKARKLYGFDNMSTKSDAVSKAILDIQSIREAIDNIAAVENKVLLSNFGMD